MSVHSYTNIWLHLIWGTYNREKSIVGREMRKQLSQFYYEYSRMKKIYMKVNYVNSDHVHALIDLPTNLTVEDTLHLLKGASSNWLNKKVNHKFSWGKGYVAFSVSGTNLAKVVNYIQNQEEHHRNKSFMEEYNQTISRNNTLRND